MIKMFQLKGGICELNFGYNEVIPKMQLKANSVYKGVIRNLGIFKNTHFMEAL